MTKEALAEPQEPQLPEFYAELEYENPDWGVAVAVYQRRADKVPLLVHLEALPKQQPAQPVREEWIGQTDCGHTFILASGLAQPEQGSLSNGFWVVEMVDTVVNAWPLSQEALLKIALGAESMLKESNT